MFSAPAAAAIHRRFPQGAEIVDGRVHARVWAPAARRVEVVLSRATVELDSETAGYFSGWIPAAPGDRYQFRLDRSDELLPDPASRCQPDGPHGASRIVDPSAYPWRDQRWKGVSLKGQVLYELHVGTFTRKGTLDAAAKELPELASAGITVVELMPLAEFDGRFGWGYDGVDLFAPSHLYGTPDDLRHFVDEAHAVGVAVLLDVVYNHFGPSGNYLRRFAPAYFTDRYRNEWGDPINFDGPDAGPVREFFIANAGYWIAEFHFDGLRLDATQQMYDGSGVHILTEIGAEVRQRARGRRTLLIAENEPQDAGLVAPPDAGGCGLDALWNDDFHHSAMVALTGKAEAYYCDTRGEPQELISALKYGYLFQGQYYDWQKKLRGTPTLKVDPARFVLYLQNHDQVANSARGLRGQALTSPGKWRAMTSLLLLAPGTPMLFQGQEFGSSARFLYFADFDDQLAQAIREGRSEFLLQFPSARGVELDDPSDPRTFEACKLDFAERRTHAEVYQLHKDLLRLRRETPAFRRQRRGGLDGAVLSATAFALRWFGQTGEDDRLLIVNLGAQIDRGSFAEPLTAPPAGRQWHLRWSSEAPEYGGCGTPPIQPDERWHVPGEAAILLEPRARAGRVAPGVTRRTA